MTKYGRSYTPPVFHLEKADEDQKAMMQIVFDTLEHSKIDFAVVSSTEKTDTLNIKSYGSFTLEEKGDILTEVVQMYIDGSEINSIKMV